MKICDNYFVIKNGNIKEFKLDQKTKYATVNSVSRCNLPDQIPCIDQLEEIYKKKNTKNNLILDNNDHKNDNNDHKNDNNDNNDNNKNN